MTEEIIRKKIKLTPEQIYNLCTEHGYIPTSLTEFVPWTLIEDKYVSSTRHTEVWVITLMAPDGDYYQTYYEKSVKDSMGWDECNGHHNCILTQVFPKTITKTIYE